VPAILFGERTLPGLGGAGMVLARLMLCAHACSLVGSWEDLGKLVDLHSALPFYTAYAGAVLLPREAHVL
jgi:hypothetical protein